MKGYGKIKIVKKRKLLINKKNMVKLVRTNHLKIKDFSERQSYPGMESHLEKRFQQMRTFKELTKKLKAEGKSDQYIKALITDLKYEKQCLCA